MVKIQIRHLESWMHISLKKTSECPMTHTTWWKPLASINVHLNHMTMLHQGDGSAGIVLALQAWWPEFNLHSGVPLKSHPWEHWQVDLWGLLVSVAQKTWWIGPEEQHLWPSDTQISRQAHKYTYACIHIYTKSNNKTTLCAWWDD